MMAVLTGQGLLARLLYTLYGVPLAPRITKDAPQFLSPALADCPAWPGPSQKGHVLGAEPGPTCCLLRAEVQVPVSE